VAYATFAVISSTEQRNQHFARVRYRRDRMASAPRSELGHRGPGESEPFSSLPGTHAKARHRVSAAARKGAGIAGYHARNEDIRRVGVWVLRGKKLISVARTPTASRPSRARSIGKMPAIRSSDPRQHRIRASPPGLSRADLAEAVSQILCELVHQEVPAHSCLLALIQIAAIAPARESPGANFFALREYVRAGA
jgi:hypothetical protein